MKNKKYHFVSGFLTALLFGSGLTQAQTLTWDVAGGGAWDDFTANWTGDATTFVSDGTQNVVFNKDDGGLITVTAGMNPLSTTVSAEAGTYTFGGGAIGGTGSLTKSGDGILVLSAANTYTGATTVNGGIMRVSNPNQFGGSTAFTIASDAMIDVTGSPAGSTKWPSSASSLSGAGTLRMSLTNRFNTGLNFNMSNFTGQVEVSNGQLGFHPFDSPGLSNLSGATFRAQSNTQLYMGWQGTTTNTTVVLNTFAWNNEPNNGALRGDSATLNGSVILEANSSIGCLGVGFTINAVISDGTDSFGFTKVGNGPVTLTAANTYDGNTIVNAGTLTLAANAQLKFTLGDASGISNRISGSGTVVLNGDFVIDTSAADALPSGTWILENVTSLTGAYGASFKVIDWTDAGDNKWTKTLGAKTYTFDETTGQVTLESAAPVVQTLTWDVEGGGFWDETSANWTGDATIFTSNGTQDVIFNKPEGGTISVFANLPTGVNPKSMTVSATEGTYTFTGDPITGIGSITKSGDGILVLSSANTYIGATIVNGGILRVSHPNRFGGSTAFSIASDAMIDITSSPGASILWPTIGSVLSGAGTLRMSLNSQGSNGLNYNMSDFTGVVEASNGQLSIPPAISTGLSNISNATFKVQNNLQLYLGWQGASFNTTVRLDGVGWTPEITLGALRASTATLNGSVILERNSTIGADNTFTLNAVISDEGGNFGFTKLSGGNLILTAANTYGGNTIVNAGTLTLAQNAQLKFTLGDASGVSNGISGSGTVVLNGDFVIDTTAADPLTAGTWTIESVNSLTGAYGTSFKVVDWTDAGDDQWTKVVGSKKYTFDETTGIVTLETLGAGYGSWATANDAGANLNDDHDGDGVPNGVEYFLGGPNGITTGFTALPGVIDTAGTLRVTWTKSADYVGVYGTDFVVETSETLTGTWTTESSPGTVTISGNNVTYTFPAPLGAKKFARLKVTGP